MSELRGLGAVHEDLRARGGMVVAVSADPPERVREVVEGQRLPFPVVSDPGLAVTRAFGLVDSSHVSVDGDIAIPAQVLVDRDGVVRWRHVSAFVQDRMAPSATRAAVAASLGAR
ncbi:MAG: redoxin domain-containing protein [Planctomycetota bacterium]